MSRRLASFGTVLTAVVGLLVGLTVVLGATAASAISAPTNVVAVAYDGEAAVTWTPTTEEINLWYVEVYEGSTPVSGLGAYDWGPDDPGEAAITGLTNGHTYTFRVSYYDATWTPTAYTASNAVTAGVATAVPSTPGALSATATIGGSASLSWSRGSTFGSDHVTNYAITSSPSGVSQNVAATATSTTLTGLTYGTAYTFTIKAVNSYGQSAGSTSSSVTSGNVPGTPSWVSPGMVPASSPSASDGGFTVSWVAPASNGSPITGYTITPSVGSPVTVSGSTTSYSFTGLAPGTSRSFTVKATNAWGNGANSAAASGTVRALQAPIDVTAVARNGEATVSWSRPSGLAAEDVSIWYVQSYEDGVLSSAAAGDLANDPGSAIVTGLTNGHTYTFKVGFYEYGWFEGPLSSASNAVTPWAPSAVPANPTSVSATATIGGGATITWADSTSFTADQVDSYKITASPGGASKTVSASTHSTSFTGLTLGTAYTFTVKATNVVGDSTGAAASAITSGNVPGTPVVGAPIIPASSPSASDGGFMVTWAAPASNGSAITSYTITPSVGSPVTVSGSTTSYNFTGLAPGTTRSFTVKATNAWGSGANSAPASNTVKALVAPVDVTAVARNGEATVSWSRPSSLAAEDVSIWYVQAYEDGVAVSAAAGDLANDPGSATVTGLTNGHTYTFKVGFWEYGWFEGPLSSASNAVTPWAPSAVPANPTSVSATATIGGGATVTWADSSSFVADQVDSYKITASPGGASKTVSASTHSTSFTGLTLGTAYTFTVKATNVVGDSAGSTSSAVTSGNIPGVPSWVSAPIIPASSPSASDGGFMVSWIAPADNGAAITSYTITPSVGSPVTVSGSSTSYNFTGLAPGTSRSFTVKATNAWGTSANSSSASNTVKALVAPTDVTAVARNGEATVSWSRPSSLAAEDVSIWYVQAYEDGVAVSASAGDLANDPGSATVTGLTNGHTYTFKVGFWEYGWFEGPLSAASNAVTPWAPSAVPANPTSVSATATIGGGANVTWADSSSFVADQVDSYKITASPGGASKTVSASTHSTSFTGLTLGTAYTFTVKATNVVGDSTGASASPVTSGNIPGTPSGVYASMSPSSSTSASDGALTVTWTAPPSNGSAITGYTITPSTGSPVTVSGSTTSYAFTGLAGGTTRSFTVKATNAWGNSANSSSTASSTVKALQAATGVSAVAGNGQATVSWSRPSGLAAEDVSIWYVEAYEDGVATGIYAYDLASDPGTAVVSGLTNGHTYTFKVTFYEYGWYEGPLSTASNAVTPSA